jgi:hypothetical protein
MARAVAPRIDPHAVGERFQMAAHRGLGQLHNIAQFGDGELITVKDRQHPHADRVGEDKKLINDWRRSIHPFIRMEGYINYGELTSTVEVAGVRACCPTECRLKN